MKYIIMEYAAEMARTTTDPKILTEILKMGKNDMVSHTAVCNPNCPKEILAEILRKGKTDKLSCNAAYNPNCPKEILIEILRKEEDNEISLNAAENINCPDEAKINWMIKTGKIEKEDPSKHIIEYENIKDDFQDLKDLL